MRKRGPKAPSSSEEGVGGGGASRRTLLDRAAELRRNPPEPERVLWRHLRASQLDGHKFRRQHVIGSRIVDFFCPERGVVIEVDGDTHDRERDARRDEAMLREFGYRTIRFTNLEVMENTEGVLETLRQMLASAPDRWPGRTTPQPPPLKRRGSSVSEALRDATARLAETSDTARLDAELLLAHALAVSRSDMLLRHADSEVPPGFAALVERRAAHEPVAYILGQAEFFGRPFNVTRDVLVPRGDSETTVQAALDAARADARVLDCGVGSGALLLTFLAERPAATGVGIDVSAGAASVATANADWLGLAERVRVVRRDWTRAGWAEDLGRFDLVLANPPYVETTAELAAEVRDFEPASALFAGADGLDDYRVLVPQLPQLLTKTGVAVLEIGATQAAEVTKIAAEHGFTAVAHKDLGGRDRALVLRLTLGKGESSS